MSGRDLPQNVLNIARTSRIEGSVSYIDEALNRFAVIQLRCGGTAIQRLILIAEKCVEQGIAEYSRFTSQLVPVDGKDVVYTIAKLRRPRGGNNKEQKSLKQERQVKSKPSENQKNSQQQGKQYVQKRQERPQEGNRRQGHKQERGKREAYNEEHRERNERRERDNYREDNERVRGERSQGQRGNQNERNRDRDYR